MFANRVLFMAIALAVRWPLWQGHYHSHTFPHAGEEEGGEHPAAHGTSVLLEKVAYACGFLQEKHWEPQLQTKGVKGWGGELKWLKSRKHFLFCVGV